MGIPSYERYLETVGDATHIDITRRADPARTDQPWEKLERIFREYGAPWIVQIWTKGPRGVVERGGELLRELQAAGTALTCHLTITGLGPIWEPRAPWPIDWEGIDLLIDLLGSGRAVCWRYDPVVPGISRLQTFEDLAKNLSERGVTLGSTKWMFHDRELIQNRLGTMIDSVDEHLDRVAFMREIGRIGRKYKISFSVCAENRAEAEQCGLASRACSDYPWYVEVSGREPKRGFVLGPSRAGCQCAAYYDVGHYRQWGKCHGCMYCYSR